MIELKKLFFTGGGVGLALFMTSCAVFQPSPPSAAELADNMKAAVGSADILNNIKSSEFTMDWKIDGTGVSAETKVFYLAPDKFLSETLVFEQIKMLRGYNGETGWEYSEMKGLVKAEQPEAKTAFALDAAIMNPSTGVLELYQSFAVSDGGVVNGRRCWRMDCQSKPEFGGLESVFWIDRDTWLTLRKKHSSRLISGQPFSVTADYRDYREIDGVKAPFSFTMKMGEVTMKFSLKSVRWNPELEPEIFNPPQFD